MFAGRVRPLSWRTCAAMWVAGVHAGCILIGYEETTARPDASESPSDASGDDAGSVPSLDGGQADSGGRPADGGQPHAMLELDGSGPGLHVDGGREADAAWWEGEEPTESCGADADCSPTCLPQQESCVFACTQANNCKPSCEKGSLCHLTCSGTNNCELTCDEGAFCSSRCEGPDADNCSTRCEKGSTCDITCTEVNNCEVECREGSRCSIDCRSTNNCDAIECAAGAVCSLHCEDSENCSMDCAGTGLSCPDGLRVCNGFCPE